MNKKHGLLAALALAAACAQAQDEKLPLVTVWGQPIGGAADSAGLSQAWDAQALLSELPMSATVVEAQRLRQWRPGRLEDLAGLVPGMSVDVSGAGLASAVKLRGFSLTRMLYDGLPDIQRLFARDLATVDRVEVLAGPAAVLFGITSPGGVVNYAGKRPEFSAHHDASLTVGSNALVRSVLDSTGPLGDADAVADSAWAYRFVAAAQDGHTAIAHLPTRSQQGLGALTWAYDRSPGAAGSITLDLQEQRSQTPYLFGTVITNGGDLSQGVQPAQVQFGRLYVLPGGAPAERRYHSGGLRWEQALGPGWALSAQYRQAVVTRDETLLGFWTVDTPTALSGYYTRDHDGYRQHNLRVQLEAVAATGLLDHRAVLGYADNLSSVLFTGVQNIGGFSLDVAEPDFSAVDVAALPTRPRFTDEKQRDAAWWLADRMSFGAAADPASRTHLTLGLRSLRYAIESDRVGSGRVAVAGDSGASGHVGLNTPLWPAVRGYTAWSTGLEPNRGRTSGGEFLPPQQSRQWELGVNWQLAPRSTLHAAAYRVDLLNLAMTDPQDRTASISAGRRRVKGVEAALDVAAQGWLLNLNASASRTRHLVKTGTRLGDEFAGVPARTAGLQVGHDMVMPAGVPFRWWAAATAVGPRFADAENTVRTAGYTRVDLGGESALGQGLSVSAGVRNLGNRRYVEAVTALDDVYAGPLRQFWVGIALAR